MLRYRNLPLCSLLLLLAADTARAQSVGHDLYGDALPAGAVARLGTVRFRHDAPIVFTAFLPDGKGVLSVSEDGAICAWEFPSGKPIGRFEALANSPPATVTGATLSPDGKHLTAFCSDGFMRICDWAQAKELGKVAHRAGATSSTRSSSPFASSAVSRTRPRPPGASGLFSTYLPEGKYSPDNKTLMLLGSPRVLQFVDLPGGKEIGPGLGHIEPVTSVAFAPDGKILTKDTNATHTWDTATGNDLGALTVKLPSAAARATVVISPDGRVGALAASGVRVAGPGSPETAAGDIVLFDAASGKELGEIKLSPEMPSARQMFFSPDGKQLALNAGADENQRQRIALYDVPGRKLVRMLDVGPAGSAAKAAAGFAVEERLSSRTMQMLLFSPDGKALAFQAGLQAPIAVVDTVTGKQISSLTASESGPLLPSAFSPDGRCLAVQTSDGTLSFYELATGRPRHTYPSRLHAPTVAAPAVVDERLAELLARTRVSSIAIAISPDGRLLAWAGAGGPVLFDVLTGKELMVFKGHTRPINAVAFAPDGKTLASASDDTTALIWDVTKIARPAIPTIVPNSGDLESSWQALADDDAGKAFAALGALAAAPKDTVAWIKDRVKPAAPLDMKRVLDLIHQLDDDQLSARDKAASELLDLGEPLLPVLDKALAENPTPESRLRLQELRGKLLGTVLQGERLRAFRAVEVLELIGTPDARQVLQTLADGAPGALLTTSAQAALKRPAFSGSE
jgi:WD40 repeat protein